MKTLILFVLLPIGTIAIAQYSRFDDGVPTKIQVYRSMYDLQSLLKKDKPNLHEIYLIYSNEIIVGKYYLGIGAIDTLPFYYRGDRKYGVDSVKMYCKKYLNNYSKRFRNILSGWKDEESYYEPNYYWLNYIKRIDSTSIEAQLISFDLEFKDFIRQYEIDINRESFDLTVEEFYTMWANYTRRLSPLPAGSSMFLTCACVRSLFSPLTLSIRDTPNQQTATNLRSEAYRCFISSATI